MPQDSRKILLMSQVNLEWIASTQITYHQSGLWVAVLVPGEEQNRATVSRPLSARHTELWILLAAIGIDLDAIPDNKKLQCQMHNKKKKEFYF